MIVNHYFQHVVVKAIQVTLNRQIRSASELSVDYELYQVFSFSKVGHVLDKDAS